jgi:tRNA-dihydrouridine synthase A
MLARVDGVMLGRAAYHNPTLLAGVDQRFYGDAAAAIDPRDAAEAMLPYIAREVAGGTHLAAIVRHMLGLFQGLPGARRWRQILTVDAIRPGAGVEAVEAALAAVDGRKAPAATAVAAAAA